MAVGEKDRRGRELWDGARIKALREARGLSQAELGEAAGIGGAEISRHETNQEKSNPTIAVLARIAKALNYPLPELFLPADSRISRPEETGHATSIGGDSGGTRIEDHIGALMRHLGTLDDKARGEFIRALVALLDALEHSRPAASGGTAANDGP